MHSLTVSPGAPVFPSLPGSPGGPRIVSRNISLSLIASRISDALHVHLPVYFCNERKSEINEQTVTQLINC